MSAPSEKEPQQGQGLPDPELNPLTNPLLAKNMGKWAEVYFTNPPEKREEAVQDLLRELRSKEGGASTESASTQDDNASALQDAEVKSEKEEAPVCPACLQKNRAGDRYCGLCGFSLKTESKEAVPASLRSEHTPTLPPEPIERKEDGWEWLREKNFATFHQSSEPHTNVWKYVAVIAVLALCAVGAYRVWSRTAAAGKPAAASVTPAQNSPAAPSTQTQEQAKQEAKPSPPATDEAQSSSQPAGTQSKSEHADSAADQPSTSEEATPATGGQQELLEAKRYLDGKGVPKSSTAAAVLLWKSVAKKNSEAVVLLSDLYARGDGVPQSCDQALLLLRAAARRGSAEAGERLAVLRSAGCR